VTGPKRSPASHSGFRRDPNAANTEAVEDYAKTIYALEQRGGEPVGTSALAQRLGVSPGTATAMIKRLAEMGLAEHVPYQGVSLTEAGRRVALEVIRHHRLIESYLADALGMPWDRVHDEAEVLEHYISEELEQRMAEKLGDPTHDPHGDPIPSVDLDVAVDPTLRLSELGPGDAVSFERVSDSDPEMLRFLGDRGIRPGVHLRVLSRDPFEGPIRVEAEGVEHALGFPLAASMRVRMEGAAR
jgi:DtxR family Mn-dependent transcriptional regulator